MAGGGGGGGGQGGGNDQVVGVIEKELGVDIRNIFFLDGSGTKTTKTPAAPG